MSGAHEDRGGSGGRSAPGPGSSEKQQKWFMDPPEEADEFFEATRQGRLLIQKCSSCGKYQFYPRKICIHCGSSDVEWFQASGRGKVHTFTVIHQQGMPGWRDETPYAAAIIDLEEGVRMTSVIVDCSPGDVSVDMPVEVKFVDEGTYVLPRFRPV